MKKVFCLFTAISLSLSILSQTPGTASGDSLYRGFITPPNSAKPRVWWHWMNGNITKDGIGKDLHWMKRAGIGGFQNFDAGMTTPQIVPKRLSFMTPDWKDAFAYTARVADSLKLEMAIAGSPGWSESGGPWVPGKDAMKKVVWTETNVPGGQSFSGEIPKPPATTGLFQNVPLSDALAGLLGKTPDPPQYYHDIAVIAYKLPDAEIPIASLQPKVSSSGGNFNLTQLTDGDLATTALLPSAPDTGKAWIQYEFEKPQEIKAITIVGGGEIDFFGSFTGMPDKRVLLASDDGASFRVVQSIASSVSPRVTLNIRPTTAKYFRITFTNPPTPMDMSAMFGGKGQKPEAPKGNYIAEVMLHNVYRENRVEDKAAFTTASGLAAFANKESSDTVATAQIVDLTSKISQDGKLTWQVPAGNWKIVRVGYSLTGKQNHPASFEATGPEVDKLDASAVKSYFTKYLDQYLDASGGMMGKKGGLQFMVNDSWEAGAENWTEKMPEEFLKRRGYDIRPWLPVITGQIIGSAEASDHFLWDFRKTIAELTAENHYDQLTDMLAARGMKRYTESHEAGRAINADGMDIKRRAAVPMSAIWTPNPMMAGDIRHRADIRESASVAHIYGQNFVAAESLTALGNAFAFSPERLKPTADIALASGLNRFVIHTSVHQPVDDKIPGLGLGPFGQWFTRHETWAEQAKAWTGYLARSCYMLQQGKFVADVLYYYGEDNNITALFGNKLPDVPRGYNFDFANPNVLLHELSVKDGKIVTKTGMQYRLLALDSNSMQMTVATLKKIRELVAAGAMVSGPKPQASPSLKDDPATFKSLVDELWPADNAATIGKGKVYGAANIADVLKQLNVAPDFDYSNPAGGEEVYYVHRRLPDADIYWVNNHQDSTIDVTAMFRVSGKTPEIWHPETGEKEVAGYSTQNGITTVPLHLVNNDAVFVVFRKAAAAPSKNLASTTEKEIATVAGPWTVKFQEGRGAPASTSLKELTSWTENTNPGVKYFSGTGAYTTTLEVPANAKSAGSKLFLDLGDVKNLAEVLVNGKSLGIFWKKPFRIDITQTAKAGSNTLEVRVTNLWVNRLIGDAQPGVEKKITYTTIPFYQASSPLLPSGLLGPVRLLTAVRQ